MGAGDVGDAGVVYEYVDGRALGAPAGAKGADAGHVAYVEGPAEDVGGFAGRAQLGFDVLNGFIALCLVSAREVDGGALSG